MTSKKDIEEVENEIFHRNHPGYPGNHRRYRGKVYSTYGNQRGRERQQAKVAILYYAKTTNVLTAAMDWGVCEKTIHKWRKEHVELSAKVPDDILKFWGTEIMSEGEWNQKRVLDRKAAASDSHIARLKSCSQGGVAQAGDYRRVNALLSLIAQQSLKSEPIQAAESVKTAELCLKTAEIHQSVVKDTPGKFDAVAETLKHNTDTTRFQLTELQAEMSAIKENTVRQMDLMECLTASVTKMSTAPRPPPPPPPPPLRSTQVCNVDYTTAPMETSAPARPVPQSGFFDLNELKRVQKLREERLSLKRALASRSEVVVNLSQHFDDKEN
ncbi:hypothetical protein CYMTET_19973 [Cymbomonas tetramitiformis]|uniref:Uncharacterized protein n=1 Tax=Cymbomonas tetramitiformis TaxID=36881 RepID=A0AAE0G5L9_9CHLO|nr:hypothetical protein CYMTET_19973 [Cymbomonas tetramitiformis]